MKDGRSVRLACAPLVGRFRAGGAHPVQSHLVTLHLEALRHQVVHRPGARVQQVHLSAARAMKVVMVVIGVTVAVTGLAMRLGLARHLVAGGLAGQLDLGDLAVRQQQRNLAVDGRKADLGNDLARVRQDLRGGEDAACCMLWVTMAIVYSLFSSWTSSSTFAVEIGSRAEVASSSKRTSGLTATPRAMQSRCC